MLVPLRRDEELVLGVEKRNEEKKSVHELLFPHNDVFCHCFHSFFFFVSHSSFVSLLPPPFQRSLIATAQDQIIADWIILA